MKEKEKSQQQLLTNRSLSKQSQYMKDNNFISNNDLLIKINDPNIFQQQNQFLSLFYLGVNFNQAIDLFFAKIQYSFLLQYQYQQILQLSDRSNQYISQQNQIYIPDTARQSPHKSNFEQQNVSHQNLSKKQLRHNNRNVNQSFESTQRLEHSTVNLLASKAFVNKTKRNRAQILSCISHLKKYQQNGQFNNQSLQQMQSQKDGFQSFNQNKFIAFHQNKDVGEAQKWIQHNFLQLRFCYKIQNRQFSGEIDSPEIKTDQEDLIKAYQKLIDQINIVEEKEIENKQMDIMEYYESNKVKQIVNNLHMNQEVLNQVRHNLKMKGKQINDSDFIKTQSQQDLRQEKENLDVNIELYKTLKISFQTIKDRLQFYDEKKINYFIDLAIFFNSKQVWTLEEDVVVQILQDCQTTYRTILKRLALNPTQYPMLRLLNEVWNSLVFLIDHFYTYTDRILDKKYQKLDGVIRLKELVLRRQKNIYMKEMEIREKKSQEEIQKLKTALERALQSKRDLEEQLRQKEHEISDLTDPQGIKEIHGMMNNLDFEFSQIIAGQQEKEQQTKDLLWNQYFKLKVNTFFLDNSQIIFKQLMNTWILT